MRRYDLTKYSKDQKVIYRATWSIGLVDNELKIKKNTIQY